MLKSLLQQQINSLGISILQLSKNIGVSRSTISRYLKGDTELSFHTMIVLVKYLYQDKQHELLEMYAQSIVIPDNLKMALEYADQSRNYKLSKHLIEKQKNMKTTDNDDFAKIYNFRLMRRLGELTNEQMLDIAKRETVKTVEMSVFTQLLALYAWYQEGKRESVLEFSKGLKEKIESQISNEYIRSSYLIRLSELLGYMSLKMGDVNKGREYSSIIINDKYVGLSIAASANFVLGESYLFENYDQAHKAYLKAAEMYEKIGNYEFLRNIKNFTIPLLNLIHDKLDAVNTVDPILQAYLYAKTGEKKKAIEYLNKDTQTLSVPALTSFVKGITYNDPGILFDSLGKYIATGDYWLINLPRNELLRMGEPSYAVDSVIKNKIPDYKEVKMNEKNNSSNVVNIRSNRERKHS